MLPLKMPLLTLAIVAALIYDTYSSDCDTNWIYKFRRCYQYHPSSPNGISPNGAQSVCQGDDAMLASVNSQEELDFFVSLVVGTTYTYVGARDEKVDNVWLWADRKPAVFTPWGNTEPNNYGPCVTIIAQLGVGNRDNLLGDIPCTTPRIDSGYVCQKQSTKFERLAQHSCALYRDGLDGLCHTMCQARRPPVNHHVLADVPPTMVLTTFKLSVNDVPATMVLTTFKLRVSGKKSSKIPLSTHTVTGQIDCAILCANQDGCLSINVCGGGTVCDVLDADLADGVVTDVQCDVYYLETQD